MEPTRLKGQFVVAMPNLEDPNFHRTVVLLCEQDKGGSMGLVVNRPLHFKMKEVYEGQGIESEGSGAEPVYFGGPVQPEVGFVLYKGRQHYKGAVSVENDVYLGNTLDILQDIAEEHGPATFMFVLGYAGWGPGQLESEITRNDWLLVPFDEKLLFELPPEQRWDHAIRSLGIDPSLLCSTVGNA